MTLAYPGVLSQTPKGMGPDAELLERRLREVQEHYSEPRRQLLEPEILALADTGETDSECVTPNKETIRQAMTFAMMLPKSLPIPEVSRDPDGEISFDWIGNFGRIFSVSIGPHGRLSYAGRFSDKSKVHGVEALSETLPREILLAIEKVVR